MDSLLLRFDLLHMVRCALTHPILASNFHVYMEHRGMKRQIETISINFVQLALAEMTYLDLAFSS